VRCLATGGRTLINGGGYCDDLPVPRSAGLLVEIYPVGQPGVVGLSIHNTGPYALAHDEAVRLLRNAAERLESGQSDEF
jgi:hypothetical protein